jgi:hypothetical protein
MVLTALTIRCRRARTVVSRTRCHVVRKPGPAQGAGRRLESQPTGTSQRYDLTHCHPGQAVPPASILNQAVTCAPHMDWYRSRRVAAPGVGRLPDRRIGHTGIRQAGSRPSGPNRQFWPFPCSGGVRECRSAMSPPYRHAPGISSVPARSAGSTRWHLRPLLIPQSRDAREMTVVQPCRLGHGTRCRAA